MRKETETNVFRMMNGSLSPMSFALSYISRLLVWTFATNLTGDYWLGVCQYENDIGVTFDVEVQK